MEIEIIRDSTGASGVAVEPGTEIGRIRALLDDARRRLVETGTRNRLIHVNRAAARANALNIVGEDADAVYAMLRTGGKRMRFRALGKDRAEDADGPPLAEENGAPAAAPRHDDPNLDTLLGPEALQRRLLRLSSEARIAEEEQGVNILFLALGFLTWFEDETSSVPREAPLVLLPVELVRNERGAAFDLRARDDDLVTNLPLQERLKTDFGVTLPEIAEEEGWTPGRYVEAVAASVSARPRWAVSPAAIQLGFFSFAKLLMLRDLDPANWPDGALLRLDLVRRMLATGFAAQAPLFGPGEKLDARLDPAHIVHVVDADASQAKVIEEARAGRNLVVQGPPGTGKSQTITNIIAAAVHDGKSVLFMAEKMAALDVVHRRLAASGLRDACLELHSRGANKKAVLQEIAHTLGAGTAPPAVPGDPAELRALRARLNAHADLLHRDLPGRDYSPFDALAEIVDFIGRDVPPPAAAPAAFAAFDGATRATLAAALRDHAALRAVAGPRQEHPFAGTTNWTLQPTDLQRLARELDAARDGFAGLDAALAPVATALGARKPATLAATDTLIAVLGLLAAAPEGAAVLFAAMSDAGSEARLRAGLAAGLAWRQARDAAAEIFVDTAWSEPVRPLREPIAAGAASFLNRIFGGYRAASARLAALLRQPLPKMPADRLALVDRLAEVERRRTALQAQAGALETALGPLWRGDETPFAALEAALSWVGQVRATGLVPSRAALAPMLDAAPRAAAMRETLVAARAALAGAVAAVVARLETGPAPERADIDLAAMASRVARLRAGIGRYDEWVALSDGARRLADAGLGDLVAALEDGRLPPAGAGDAFLYACAEARWEAARAALPELDALMRTDRHALVEAFRGLERQRMRDVQTMVRAGHLAQLPRGAMGEMGILRGEIAKKRGQKPIRRLVEATGAMLRRIKPVFLMSPISIAQFLPPGRIAFDLLVIDEASQVRPEDALGAVARAAQVVVVGDRKQLPPTSFFDRLTDDLPDDPEETAEDGAAPAPAKATEMESVLTLCEARGLSARMLEWHYRSRDPSLIRVSNAEFYDDRLILPPSPTLGDTSYGLSFLRVPGVYSSKSRGGGRAGTNRIEAERIVDLVARHARGCPELSLGIVAFSKAQSDMLAEVLETARRKDGVLDAFLRQEGPEAPFVKNIENVQGDERDVILISVGYGPHEPDGRLASMNFGPVNGEGGERRLNVLFSRARRRCVAVASFDPGDIDLGRTAREGPRVLKRFLEFARSRTLDQALPTGGGAESPFEAEVARTIARLGHRADPQVGSAGFRIDLAVRHPERPGHYILAVECDGAAWHGALWARERDRLRQDVLEGMGWVFHRIWSTDWFHRRDQEIDRLRAALAAAHARADAVAAPVADLPPVVSDAEADDDRAAADAADEADDADEADAADDAAATTDTPLGLALVAPAYRRAEITASVAGEPHEAPPAVLLDLAARIVEIEGPIHGDEVARRLAAAFGKGRAGGRIQHATAAALDAARRAGRVVRRDAFWMTSAQEADPPVRSRLAEEVPTTRAVHLSALEIRAAARLLVAECGAIAPDDMPGAVARLLGYRRLGSELRVRIAEALRDGAA